MLRQWALSFFGGGVKKEITSFVGVLCLGVAGLSAYASDAEVPEMSPYWVSGEAGLTWQSRNDIEIPKGGATRYSFLDFGKGPFLTGRVYAGYSLNEKHEFRGLFAPLRISASGSLKQDTVFMGKTFLAAQKTEGVFQFNSYRLTYRYTLHANETSAVKLGFTGKIRDAEISLEQGSTRAIRSNVGFVPLLHLSANYVLPGGLVAMFDADALAAPQGRAEDVALTVGYDLSPELQVYGGYRTVEGGADAGDQDGGSAVYNFTWLHSGVVGLTAWF